MSVLYDQLKAVLPTQMHIPDAFIKLFDWMESRHYYVDNNGCRYGLLYPQKKLAQEWSEHERQVGTIIEFAANGNQGLEHWFGQSDPHVLNRLCVFAQTGAEGSMAAFWLDDSGQQKIVHMGSGSGSVLVCTLADDPVDFLRLLAIGYDEICWNECFNNPPNAFEELFVHPNTEFQTWVTDTFAVTISKTAAEIVKYPCEMGDVDGKDPFFIWCETHTA